MYAHSFLVTSVRGSGALPITAARDALGVMAFMKAALGLRFTPDAFFLGADFFADFFAVAFFAVFFAAAFFGAAFFTDFFADFLAVFFFAAIVMPPIVVCSYLNFALPCQKQRHGEQRMPRGNCVVNGRMHVSHREASLNCEVRNMICRRILPPAEFSPSFLLPASTRPGFADDMPMDHPDGICKPNTLELTQVSGRPSEDYESPSDGDSEDRT